MKPFETREFRAPRYTAAFCAIGSAVGAYAAYDIIRVNGVTPFFLAAIIICLLMLGGLADALTTKVSVSENELVVRSNFKVRRFSRSEFSSVTWSKGCPVALEFRDGSWLNLPSVAASAQGVTNTLKAWLKRANE